MRRNALVGKSLFALGVVAAGGAGLAAVSSSVQAYEVCCNCPFVELWVLCSDGNYYMNECWAEEAGATGCVYAGPTYPPPGDPDS